MRLTILSIITDIGIKAEVQRVAREIADKEPHGIQLLINNAGIAMDEETRYEAKGQPRLDDAQAISDFFMRSNPQSWADTFRINITAQFFMSMAFLPLLARGCGVVPGYTYSVVQVSSNAAFLKGNTRGYVAYSSSKAGTGLQSPSPCISFFIDTWSRLQLLLIFPAFWQRHFRGRRCASTPSLQEHFPPRSVIS